MLSAMEAKGAKQNNTSDKIMDILLINLEKLNNVFILYVLRLNDY